MIFGGWLGISFDDGRVHDMLRPRAESEREMRCRRELRGNTEDAETSCGQFAECRLAEVGDFFVEVGEGGFERLAVVGMSGGGEVVGDADAR